MRRLIPLAALACLLTGPALGATTTLCAGRVEVLSVSPQWQEDAPGRPPTGLRVVAANRSGEAILLQPLLMSEGRPQHGNPLMLMRHRQASFALNLSPEQQGMPPERLILALGAVCRLT